LALKGQSTNWMVGSAFRPTLCSHFHANDTMLWRRYWPMHCPTL